MFIYILKNLLTRKKRKDNRIGEVTNQVVKSWWELRSIVDEYNFSIDEPRKREREREKTTTEGLRSFAHYFECNTTIRVRISFFLFFFFSIITFQQLDHFARFPR